VTIVVVALQQDVQSSELNYVRQTSINKRIFVRHITEFFFIIHYLHGLVEFLKLAGQKYSLIWA